MKKYSWVEVLVVAIIVYFIASVFVGDGFIAGIIAGVCGSIMRDIEVDVDKVK